MNDIYLISGLGADTSIFQYLQLNGLRVHALEWDTPRRGESLESYAMRLSKHILSPEPILLGLSFGGMVAVEIARHRPVKQVILVSSIRHRGQLPPYGRLALALGVHHLLSESLIRWCANVLASILPDRTEADHLRRHLLHRANTSFVKWTFDAMASWKDAEAAVDIVHLHGTRDVVLPIRYVTPDIVIEGGTHFMVAQRSQELSQHINEVVRRD